MATRVIAVDPFDIVVIGPPATSPAACCPR